jgi:hypothetical protein
MNALHLSVVLYGLLIISLSLFLNTEKPYVFDTSKGVLLEQLSRAVSNQNNVLPIQMAIAVVYIPVQMSASAHSNQSVQQMSIQNILKNGI